MPQVIVEEPGLAPMTVPLAGREMRLGRAEDNDIVLRADEVSRHHAKISRRGEQVIIVDLNSLNGTYFNRQRIVQRVLAHMDEIWFGGKCRLVYRDDTKVGQEKKTAADEPSTLMRDLDKIRTEMDRVGNSLTMIGAKGRTPFGTAEPPQPTSDELVAMSLAYRRLDALYKASKRIASDFDLDRRLAAVLDTALEVMSAERGFVMIRDEKSGLLHVKVAREMHQELQASSPSMGIAGRAAIDGEPVLMRDAASDSEFGMRESVVRQHILSAMAVPLKIEDRILGSIYVDTRRADHRFTEEDLELFEALASQSAMAIENVHLYERMLEGEKRRANLGRFLSPSVVEEIMKLETDVKLGGNKTTVTTMFGDIRGFTPIAERLEPTQLVELLNEHFTNMTEIIFEFQGTLDKYDGDEIMALFGVPIQGTEDAMSAVRASLAMHAKNGELNTKRARAGQPTFEMGIGIDTGEVVAGYIGSPKRLDFTVVGDRVNTARRLCTLAGPAQTIVGDATYQLVKDKVEANPIGTVLLKGKEAPIHAYEILRLKS